MPLLIDGHNLIGQSRDLKLSDPDDETKLLHRLVRYAAKTDRKIHVIFDPNPHDDTPSLWDSTVDHGKVTAQWAPRGKKADDVIRALVGEAQDRRGLIVVTSDGAVASFVRACGVRVQSSVEFSKDVFHTLGEKPAADAKPAGSTRSEIDEWLSVFKEPESPKQKLDPLPFKDEKTEAEKKRERRMAQLRKQTKGGSRLS
jgi:uncharacterized protein